MALPLAGIAESQELNLSGPVAPAPGMSVLADELAQRFTRQAEAVNPDSSPSDPDRRAVESARRELRLAAATLAQRGNALGTDGSHLVLAAMTIDRRLESLDRLIQTAGDRALLLALTRDLETLRLEWSRGGPIAPDHLDRDLRYALAQLSLVGDGLSPATSGWVLAKAPENAPDLDAIPAVLEQAGVSRQTLALLEDDLHRLGLMRRWPGFVREAQARSSLIALAAEVLARPPGWLTAEARGRLVEDFAGAAGADDPAQRDTALSLIDAQGRVIGLLTAMGEGRQSDRLRSRASQAIADRSAPAAEALAATELALRTLETAETLSDLPRDESLLRQLRPAWRVLIPSVRDANVNARDAAVNLLVDPAGVTSPGALSAVAAQRRLRDDFALVQRLSARFSPGASPEDKANAAIADRLLAIGQDMAENASLRDPSLGLLRDLNDQLDLWDEIALLRQRVDLVIGNRRDDLTLRLEALRNQWLAGWGTPGGLGAGREVADDLRTVRDAMRAMADVSAFTDLGALESWPGFEMDESVRRIVTRELTAQIDALASEMLRAPTEMARQRTGASLVSLRGGFSPALLAGRLARLAPDTGLTPTGAIAELALGPPVTGSWMARHRDAIADVCWYAAEWSRRLLDDPDETRPGTQELRAHLRWRALRTLEAIERDEPN